VNERQRAVAKLRYAANRAIDGPYKDFAAQIEAIILERARTAPDGTKRLDAASVAAIRAELRKRLLKLSGALTLTIRDHISDAEDLAIEQFKATNPPEIPDTSRDNALTVTAIGLLVIGALERSLTQVDRVLTGAVASGVEAEIPAGRITLFFDSTFSPIRNAAGEIIRAGKAEAIASWPAASGMGSSGVRLIANHEINTANGSQAIILAQRAEGYGILWELSPGHAQFDECDFKSTDDSGLGPGIYSPFDVPEYPSHVGCQCILTTVQLDRAEAAA